MKKTHFKLKDCLDSCVDAGVLHSRLVLYGSRHLIAENHRGILEYEPEHTVIAMDRGSRVTVWGDSLCIKAMNRSQLLLSGRISGIEMEAADGKKQ